LNCAGVSKQTLFPRDPDSGNNTVAAFDAVNTYEIKLAEVANEEVTAYELVYNDAEPNGYTVITN
jgi:hypothetical protein